MSNFSELKQRFFNWLDGRFSSEQQSQFEADIEHSVRKKTPLEDKDEFNGIEELDELSELTRLSRKVKQIASQPMEQEVPEWDRSQAFKQHHQPWWKETWVNLTSLGFATASLVLLIGNAEISSGPAGWSLHFGEHKTVALAPTEGQQVEFAIDQRIEQRLQDFAEEQQLVLATYFDVLSRQQRQSNVELANYLTGHFNDQRQQDFITLTNFINQQDQQSNRLQSIQYLDLKKQLRDRANQLKTGRGSNTNGENF